MSRSTFAVILFGVMNHRDILEVILEQVPSVRHVQVGGVPNGIGALLFEQIGDEPQMMIVVYPASRPDNYGDIYDGARTVLTVHGCDADHEIIQALLNKFGGIYELKEDWMIVERHKEPHELPALAYLTLSEEYRPQMG